MILVAGFVKYPPGAIQALGEEMQKVVEATRQEDGCVNYDFAVDVADPTRLIIFERWRDQKALEAHFKSRHIAAWRQAAGGAGPVESELRVWDVGEGRRL